MRKADIKVGMNVVDPEGQGYGTVAKLEIHHLVVRDSSHIDRRFNYSDVELGDDEVRIRALPDAGVPAKKRSGLTRLLEKKLGRTH